MLRNFLLMLTVAVLGMIAVSCEEDTPTAGSIYGMISDAETGTPVSGAEVMLSPGNTTTVTGSDGNYELQNLEAGQYKLQVSAAGYILNSRQLTVTEGNATICDMQLSKEKELSGIELSTNQLKFGTSYNDLTFDIRNVSTSGDIDWTVSNVTAEWLTVSPMEGTVAMGQSASVKVTVDRSKAGEEAMTTFNVNAAGGSVAIMVTVGNDGGSDEDDGDGEGGGDQPVEDYSSAEVTSGDPRIIPEIVSCRRSGANLVFEYTLRNDGLGYVEQFRIALPGYTIGNDIHTTITDEQGNNYTELLAHQFNEQSVSSSDEFTSYVQATFPDGVKCEGSMTIKDFDATSSTLTVILGVNPYNHDEELVDSHIYFRNVPVY